MLLLSPPSGMKGGGASSGPPAVGEAVHHPDRGFGAGADLIAAPGAHGSTRIELGLRIPPVVLALLVDVAAGRERALAGARDDEAAYRAVVGQSRDRLAQLGAQLRVHRIEL